MKENIDAHRPCNWLQNNLENMDTTPHGSHNGNVSPPPTKHIILHCSVVLVGRKKREDPQKKATYLRKSSELRDKRAYDYGATQDLLSEMPLVLYKKNNSSTFGTVYFLNQNNSAQLSKLIHLPAYEKTCNPVSRWYRTVHIPWLVASYEMHKARRWLNCNPMPQEHIMLT